MKLRIPALGTLLVAALFAFPAAAHDDATLDAMPSPNGGQLRMAGIYHFELVVAKDSAKAKENPIAVYLSDHASTKKPSAGAKGMVTLLTREGKKEIALAATGDNKLEGRGVYASDSAMKAIVTLTFADGSKGQARFEPLKAAGHTAH